MSKITYVEHSGQGTATEGVGQFIPSENSTFPASIGPASTGDETTYQSGKITKLPDPGGSDYGYYNPAGPVSRKRGPHGVAGEKGYSGHIPAQGHTGEDYGNPTGTPIGINEPGKIVDVNTDGSGGGYGNFLVSKLKNGSFLKLSHLSKVYAKKGQDVGGGTVVGAVGNTGESYGPHLHLDYARKYTPANARVDQTMNPKRVTDKLGLGKASGRPVTEGYYKGGYVDKDGIVHKGEHVIDIDSSIPKVSPMLLAINAATDERGVLKAIRDYAPYEAIQSRMIPVPVEKMVPVPVPMPSNSGGGVGTIPVGRGVDTSALAAIG